MNEFKSKFTYVLLGLILYFLMISSALPLTGRGPLAFGPSSYMNQPLPDFRPEKS